MTTSDKHPLRFAAKFFLLAAVLLVSYASLLWLCNRCDRYLMGQLDKMELLRTVPSPRLVLLGGSNLAFGIDSSILERAARMPVVNMGLSGGLGLKYNLDSARPLLRKGDFVLVAPEYHQFVGTQFEGDDTLFNLFMIAPDLDILRRLKPFMALSINQSIFRFKPLKYLENRGRSRFNRYGDETEHLAHENVPFDPREKFATDINYGAMDYLAGFMRECEAAGIEVLMIYPCLSESNYRINVSTISRIETAVRRRIPHLAPQRPTDFVYDDSLFFDTIYHLNAEGRRKRTDKVAELFQGR